MPRVSHRRAFIRDRSPKKGYVHNSLDAVSKMTIHLQVNFAIVIALIAMMTETVAYEDYGNGTCASVRNLFKLVPERRQVCSYYGSCHTVTKYVAKNVAQYDAFCCPGYKSKSAGVCDPVCDPECNNGVCVRPGVCACNRGYEPINSYECSPKCDPPCVHGWCMRPDHCVCNAGYGKNITTAHECAPICSGGCGPYGYCSAPNKCACIDGWRGQQCAEPVCSLECINGNCIGPNECQCNEGFEKSENMRETNLCVPYCADFVTNALCTSPDTWTCLDGFKRSGEECTPKCDQECVNGECTAPNVCTCSEGFVESENMRETNLCVPYCADFVTNALCTSPGTWTCLDGFKRSGEECTPNCDQECVNGECTAPNVCTCSEGYVDASVNLDASKCEPFCSNGCDHGICIEPETCQCDEGYSDEDGGCAAVCHQTCLGGYCAAPGQCACADGTIKVHHFICIATCSSYQNTSVSGNVTSNFGLCYHSSEYELNAIKNEDDSSFGIVEPTTTFHLPCNYRDFPDGSPGVHDFECFTQSLNESVVVACTTGVVSMLTNGSTSIIFSENTTALDEEFNVTLILTYPDHDTHCPAHFCSTTNRTMTMNQLSDIKICMDVLRGTENSSVFDNRQPSLFILYMLIIILIIGSAAGVGTIMYVRQRPTIYRVNENLLLPDRTIQEESDNTPCHEDSITLNNIFVPEQCANNENNALE